MATREDTGGTRSYGFIAGITILVTAIVAPIAELYLYPKLVIAGNAAQIVENISANRNFLTSAILLYLLTFVGDIIVSWALYIFLKPVHRNISLLAAFFRLTFSIVSLVALLNLVTVFRLLNTSDYADVFKPVELQAQVMLLLNSFRSNYHFALMFFSVHLWLTGYLVFVSDFIPRIMGAFLIICGIGYFLDSIKPFLFPNFNSTFITLTFFGELIFMLWLIIKARKSNGS